MADGDGAAVHVYFVGIEAELAHHAQRLHREGFVEFVEIDVFVLPAGLLPDFADCINGSHHYPLRIDAAGRLRNDSDHGLDAEFAGSLRAGDDQGRGAVVYPGSIAGGYGAVFLEGRLQCAENFDGGVLAGRLVFFEERGRFAFLLRRNLHGNNLRLEAALFDGSQRFAMRVEGEVVLLFAADFIFLGDVLAGDAHVVVVVNIPEAVVHHGVDDLRVAQTISFARLRQEIRSVGHRFHSACDHDGTVSGLHGLRCESYGFESGATNFVDCHGTCRGRQSAVDGGLARGILT